MFRLRNLPVLILAFLLLLLLFFEIWTYYLGTPDVTFERLLGTKPYKEIEALSLRRYKKGEISPHLFRIKTTNAQSVIQKLTPICRLEKIDKAHLPEAAKDTDPEMVEVIGRSPYIYLSKSYDLHHPKAGRMCLVFRDESDLYLFMNGNL